MEKMIQMQVSETLARFIGMVDAVRKDAHGKPHIWEDAAKLTNQLGELCSGYPNAITFLAVSSLMITLSSMFKDKVAIQERLL